jgi:hypothetical protein
MTVSAQNVTFPSDRKKKKLPPRASKFVLKPIEEQVFEHTFPDPPPNMKFPLVKYKKGDIVLEKMTPEVEFKAGTEPKITYRLANLGLKRIVVYEWFMKEADNICLYYIPWEDGMKIPPFKEWKEIKPDVGEKPRRMTLDLHPRNSTLIDVKFSFIKDLKIYTVKDFLVFARMNLMSLPVKSRITRIRVVP